MDNERVLAEAYKKVFLGSPEGQLVFWDIMNKGHLFQDQTEFNASAYRMLGRRSLSLEIFNLVEMTPDILPGLKSQAMEKIHKSITMGADILPKKKEQHDGK